MVIGSVLLQPQRLERASQVPSDDAVLNDIISLAVRLMIDAVRGGRLGDMLAGSLAGTVARLTTRAGAGVNSAVTRFRRSVCAAGRTNPGGSRTAAGRGGRLD